MDYYHPCTPKIEQILDSLSAEERTVLFWRMRGLFVLGFTQEQEMKMLLGEPLTCPDGHRGPFFVIGPTTAWYPITKANGKYVECGEVHTNDMGSDNEVLECRHTDHDEHIQFWVPEAEKKRAESGKDRLPR